MGTPLVARYPVSAAVRGLCGAFPTLTLALSEERALIVIPDDAPIPPIGCIVDLEAVLDTGPLRAVAFVQERGLVADDHGDDVFAIDLVMSEIDARGAVALRDQRAVEHRRATDGDEAAVREVAARRAMIAEERGDAGLARALERSAVPPPPPRPVKVGYWASWNDDAPKERGMHAGNRVPGQEGRKRPKPSRHHWEVEDRFRRPVG